MEIWRELRGGAILGGKVFMEDLKPLLREWRLRREMPQRERLVARPPLEELFAGVRDKAIGMRGSTWR